MTDAEEFLYKGCMAGMAFAPKYQPRQALIKIVLARVSRLCPGEMVLPFVTA
jgi:hypothetical protein